MPGPLATRYDHPFFGDAFVVTMIATTLVLTISGPGLALGLFWGVMAGFGGLFGVAICAGMIARTDDDRALGARVITCALLALAIGHHARQSVGALGVALGVAAFAYTCTRVVLRDRAITSGKVLPEGTDDELIAAGIAALPADTSVALRHQVDTAVEDFRQLAAILTDPALVATIGLDAPGMLAEARTVLFALLTQAPRVARVQALAARRVDDKPAQEAAAAALAAQGQRSEALHRAASAAVQAAAASAVGDPAKLQDHTENLLMLRDAQAPLDPEAPRATLDELRLP